jgi:two-component system cell cycle response regulator DivK
MAIDLKGACVLIVEDNVRNCALLARLLVFLGVKQTEWKRSGWQVLEFARDTMPQVDLILLDIHLPEEDGYEVLERFRKAERFSKTLIVAVTADVSQVNLNRAKLAGFDGFLAKPINVALFPEQIRRVLLALMSNGVRITNEGSFRLSAHAGDGLVTIRVQAIGAQGQAEIFGQDPGVQSRQELPSVVAQGTHFGRGTGNRDLGRSGLGLTISREMVETLGGRIHVESHGGGDAGEVVGLAFTFTLPISP